MECIQCIKCQENKLEREKLLRGKMTLILHFNSHTLISRSGQIYLLIVEEHAGKASGLYKTELDSCELRQLK